MGEEDEDDRNRSDPPLCGCCRSKLVIFVLFLFGVAITVPAVFLNQIFQYVVGQNLILANGTEAYKTWLSAPVPVYLTYHMYNYSNIQQILTSGGAKPNVTELGPYVYKEVRVNRVLAYTDFEITYEQDWSYVFDEDLSCNTCSENDVIWTPSIPALTIINEIEKNVEFNSSTAFVLNWLINGTELISLFKNLTVKQVIWGYDDPLLTILRDIEKFLKKIGVVLPPLIKNRVALQLNSTAGMLDTGNMTCLTGKTNYKNVQKIVKWRGLNMAPFWLTKYGRMINGTDGSRAPPFTSRRDRLYTFVTQLCRSLYVDYVQDVTIRGSIKAYQFSTSADLFANHSVNPDNSAFCTEERCWGSGLLPLSACRQGIPIFMSAPHFFQADPKFVNATNGMHPNASLHGTYLDIEPTTGMAVEAHKRLQINVLGRKGFLSITKPLQNAFNFLPIAWVDESETIDEESARTLYDEVLYPQSLLVYGQYLLISVGSALCLSSLVLSVLWVSGRQERLSYTLFFDDQAINS